jgi:hypothetical protein
VAALTDAHAVSQRNCPNAGLQVSVDVSGPNEQPTRSRHVPGIFGAVELGRTGSTSSKRAIVLTPVAFYQVVMTKAFRRLVEDGTEVASTPACGQPRSCSPCSTSNDQGDDIVEMRRQVNLIIHAVTSTVPQQMLGGIFDKLDQFEPHRNALDVGTDSFDNADDDFFDRPSSTRATSFDLHGPRRHRMVMVDRCR